MCNLQTTVGKDNYDDYDSYLDRKQNTVIRQDQETSPPLQSFSNVLNNVKKEFRREKLDIFYVIRQYPGEVQEAALALTAFPHASNRRTIIFGTPNFVNSDLS